MPMTGSAIDCYEDMFKEITRKLYGEDGLPDLSANERLASTSTDRGLTPIEYEVENPILKPEEHLTAFGLAALMQNGFPPSGILNPNFQCHKPNTGTILNTAYEDKWISSEENLQWTESKIATYNPAQKLYRCSECDCVGYLLRVAEHWLGTHSTLRAFHCPQCPYESAWARCVRIHLNRQHNINTDESCDTFTKDNPVLQEIVKYLQKLKNKLESNCNKNSAPSTVQSEDYHSHPLEQRNRTNSSNILRTTTFNGNASSSASNSITNQNTVPCSSSQPQNLLKTHDLTTAAALLQQSNRFLQSDAKTWKQHIPKQHGAARLFSYMEASDGSEPESEPRVAEDMSRINLSHRIQSDFPEAGDVGNQVDEEHGEEMELPLFVCQTCGCEFEDDLSLETHQYTHRHSATSPAKTEHSKENVDPDLKYRCRLCDAAYDHQSSIIAHMVIHTTLGADTLGPPVIQSKRSRKQNQPKKLVLPFWDPEEIEVVRHLNIKLRRWKETLSTSIVGVNRLVDKHVAKLVTRKGLACIWCKNTGLSKFHTKATLALHHYWRHTRKKFKCEHCDMAFKHRYQTVLHSSRVHTNQKSQFVPTVLPKEPMHLALSAESVCSSQDTSLFFSNTHTVYVPDATMSNAHKLGMSFFDHSFIHPSNAINNHMPIIIPTFPPN
ncbi:unnamed protein product [Diabrotica balteata]|uniref:C2H2-type domain-containing protein n=1 Tax=Diabrotica balteata TaxID=107213 RepID=A0A9N9SNT3_DIABA|nr:unnamed protein product [Diabrotica balteata]